jgi:outer membrane cobalamin receptor
MFRRLKIRLSAFPLLITAFIAFATPTNPAYGQHAYPVAATSDTYCAPCAAAFRNAATTPTENRLKSMPPAPEVSEAAFADDYTMGELLVTARRENESLDDPPVFVEIINMDKQVGRMITTEEVVSQATGVNVREFGGLGSASTISIRGSSSDQVVVLLDGIRLNPSGGGGVDLSTIPAEHIASIEVIRGGDSAFYGDGALGGVINIKTKKLTGRSITTLNL